MSADEGCKRLKVRKHVLPRSRFDHAPMSLTVSDVEASLAR